MKTETHPAVIANTLATMPAEPRNLHELSETAINRIIFDGAGVYEHRGLSDSLTDDEIISLADHPGWHDFTTCFQDWIWQSIDSILHADSWLKVQA